MKNQLIVPIGLILVSSFLLYYFISPNVEYIKQQTERVTQLNRIIDEAIRIQQLRDDLLDSYNKIDEDTLKFIVDALPVFNNETLAQGLIDISYIANSSGLPQSSSINISSDAGKESNIGLDIKEAVIIISADMPLSALYSFIRRINDWNRAVIIDSLDISPTGNKSGNVRAIIRVRLLFT